MAYTITPGTGSNVTVGTNPTPAYPSSGLGAGRLALLMCWVRGDTGGSLIPPAGWTQRGSTVSVVSDNFQSIFSHELDGSETPGDIITVSSTGTTGRRVAWINIVDTPGGSGWNFENITSVSAGAGQTTINDKAVTTGGNGRLAVNFIGYANRQTSGQENFINETGGDWIAASYFESGNPPTFSLQTAELASAGTIDGGSDTSITATPYIIHGFSLWRNVSATLPDLTVSDISWTPSSPTAGDSVVFSAIVQNVGSVASPDVVHKVTFAVEGSNVATSTSHNTGIAPSGSAACTADAGWVAASAGTFAVIAIINPDETIAEATSSNNSFSENITIQSAPAGPVTKFNGRNPNTDGNIVPLQADYDQFFLTQAEADALYLTQSEADTQGMPVIRAVAYSGGGTPGGPVSYGTGNITLRVPSTSADYWQTRLNTGTSSSSVSAPSGYTISGPATIDAGASSSFVLGAGTAFQRWS